MLKCILLTAFMAVSQFSYSQIVTGIVYEIEQDQKVPLPGANIYWSGTTVGSVSQADGSFKIPVNGQISDILVFSFVGLESDSVDVQDLAHPVNVTLSGTKTIKEINVIAKGPGAFHSHAHPIQQQIITSNELRKAACCNLSESFQTNASVDVNYSDAVTGAKQIQLLGLGGIYTQMMAENIPNLRGLGTTYGLGYIPGSWMESISVSKGTSQVINGYESITGQINVEYKKPNNIERLFVNGYANNFGKYEANINSVIPVGPKLKTIFLAHYENLSMENDHNEDGFIDDPLVKQINLMNRWYFEPNENVEWRFGFNVIDEDRQGGQVGFREMNESGNSVGYGTGFKTRRYELFSKSGFFFKNYPERSLGIILNGTYHDQNAFLGKNLYRGTQKSFYGNAIYQAEIGNPNHQFSTGISIVQDNYDEALNNMVMDRNDFVPGAFFQYTYILNEKLTFLTGIRGDYFDGFGLKITPRFHFRWGIDDNSTLRLSAGRGIRKPLIVAENLQILASSRSLEIAPHRDLEDAVNYGINFLRTFRINDRAVTANFDFFHTKFNQQLIVDNDRSPQNVYIYNLNGRSYSNSFQAEVKVNLIENLDLTGAFRVNDVKMTISDTLRQKPYTSKFKGLIAASYASSNLRWKIDLTAQFNGPGRIPSTASNPEAFRRPDRFDAYTVIFGQVTRSFKRFDLYLGSENLTGFKQDQPIIAANDPFGDHFDASMIWGPLSGRMIYGGFRVKLFK